MKVMPVYCIPDKPREHTAAVEKIKKKDEPEISFKEILNEEKRKINEGG